MIIETRQTAPRTADRGGVVNARYAMMAVSLLAPFIASCDTAPATVAPAANPAPVTAPSREPQKVTVTTVAPAAATKPAEAAQPKAQDRKIFESGNPEAIKDKVMEFWNNYRSNPLFAGGETDFGRNKIVVETANDKERDLMLGTDFEGKLYIYPYAVVGGRSRTMTGGIVDPLTEKDINAVYHELAHTDVHGKMRMMGKLQGLSAFYATYGFGLINSQTQKAQSFIIEEAYGDWVSMKMETDISGSGYGMVGYMLEGLRAKYNIGEKDMVELHRSHSLFGLIQKISGKENDVATLVLLDNLLSSSTKITSRGKSPQAIQDSVNQFVKTFEDNLQRLKKTNTVQIDGTSGTEVQFAAVSGTMRPVEQSFN